MNWEQIIPAIVGTGLFTWLATIIVQAMKSKDVRFQVQTEIDAQLEKDRQAWIMEMMGDAREQLSQSREECRQLAEEIKEQKSSITRMEMMQDHVDHFEASLDRLDEAMQLFELIVGCVTVDELEAVKAEIAQFGERVTLVPLPTLRLALARARQRTGIAR